MIRNWLKRNGIALVALVLAALGVASARAAVDADANTREEVATLTDRIEEYPDAAELSRSVTVSEQFRDAFEQAMDAETYAEGVDIPVDADILVLTGDLYDPTLRLRPSLELGSIRHETSLGPMLYANGNHQTIQGMDARTVTPSETYHPILDADIGDALDTHDASIEDVIEDLRGERDDETVGEDNTDPEE